MCQAVVRRLFNPSERCHVRKVARLLAQALSQYFLGMDQERFGLSFDAAIHTGTLLAAVLFFRGDLLAMARAFLDSLPHPTSRTPRCARPT
jgi:undecaprenyl pyrophosphate phosphatase UppP